MNLYLASGSLRRREILENLGFKVIRIPADIDETPHSDEDAADYVQRMAREKNAAAVAQWFAAYGEPPEYPILTADTTVAYQNHILGKPETEAQAAEMLARLSGRTHQVLTRRMRILAGKDARRFTNQRRAFQNLVCRRNIRLYPKRRTDGQGGRIWYSGFGRRVCRAFARQFYRRDGPARLRNGRAVETVWF